LQGRELGEGSGELAVIGGVIAEQEFGGESYIARASERRNRADGGRSDQFILQSDVAIEGRLLHAPNSQLTPARGGHGFDQRELRGRAGLVLIEIGVKKIVEALRAFLFEDDGAGEEPVLEAVAGGVAFTLIRDGALGTGSVGSGGLDLFVRGHGCFRRHFGRE
jgi:hypothetical protein